MVADGMMAERNIYARLAYSSYLDHVSRSPSFESHVYQSEHVHLYSTVECYSELCENYRNLSTAG